MLRWLSTSSTICFKLDRILHWVRSTSGTMILVLLAQDTLHKTIYLVSALYASRPLAVVGALAKEPGPPPQLHASWKPYHSTNNYILLSFSSLGYQDRQSLGVRVTHPPTALLQPSDLWPPFPLEMFLLIIGEFDLALIIRLIK